MSNEFDKYEELVSIIAANTPKSHLLLLVPFAPPLGGKGTLTKFIMKNFENVSQISTSNLIQVNTGADITSGRLYGDDEKVTQLVLLEVQKCREEGAKIIILDGYPRNPVQAMDFMDFLKEPTLIPVIHVAEEEIWKRAKNRLTCPCCKASYSKEGSQAPKISGLCDKCGHKLEYRADDGNEEILKIRLETYNNITLKALSMLREAGKYPIVEL